MSLNDFLDGLAHIVAVWWILEKITLERKKISLILKYFGVPAIVVFIWWTSIAAHTEIIAKLIITIVHIPVFILSLYINND